MKYLRSDTCYVIYAPVDVKVTATGDLWGLRVIICRSVKVLSFAVKDPKVTWTLSEAIIIREPANNAMDGFDNLSATEKAEASELQRMIAVEQQKAQFQAQVRRLNAPHGTKGVALRSLQTPILGCLSYWQLNIER